MNCPVCQVELKMADRQGVEIDYCPKCRGVWLDRGELDKIIERSAGPQSGEARRPAEYDRGERGSYEYTRDQQQYYGKKRKREGFLSDLFDFD
jgi:Zn-finger nucleic acid-binding protein